MRVGVKASTPVIPVPLDATQKEIIFTLVVPGFCIFFVSLPIRYTSIYTSLLYRLKPEQRIPDELAALGELAKERIHRLQIFLISTNISI